MSTTDQERDRMSAGDDEQEWSVDWFLDEIERVKQNPPPAPTGMEFVECTAEPRHWPMYVATVDGMYPCHCLFCERDDLARQLRKVDCEKKHRRWRSWLVVGRLARRGYSLGVIPAYSTSFGRCEFCGVGRQVTVGRWRGRRSYILGVKRETWSCLRRGHRHSPTNYGLCSVCCPCPSCGSTDPMHSGDCGEAADD